MKKLFQVLFLALLMFSCGTEEDEGTTDTVDVPQDKQNLDQGIKDAINCIGRMGEGEAVESFKLFSFELSLIAALFIVNNK